MRRLSIWGALFVAPLLFGLPSAAGKAPVPRTVRTPVLWAIAMDGPRVAYHSEANYTQKIVVWNVLTGRRTLMSGSGTSGATNSSGPWIWGLAIAGRRVAWIAAMAGNSERDETLFTSSLPAPRERKLAGAVRSASDCPTGLCPEGDWIHGLVGSGSVLAVSRWKTGDDGSTLAGGGLDLITARGLRQIVPGSNGIVAADSDANRIAVLHASGRFGDSFIYKPSDVAIYSTGGRLLKRFEPAGVGLNGSSQMAEVALQGDDLAVLTPQPRLELYNWRTGKLLHSWRVPRGARQLDVQGKVATYIVGFEASGRSLHVVGLRSGKDAVLVGGGEPPTIVDVAIEAPGLAYGVNEGNGYGELDFVPMPRVLAAIAKGRVR
jgi:hypothetical protein